MWPERYKGAFPGCYNDSRMNFSLFGVQSGIFGDGLQIWIRIKKVHGVAIAIIFLIRKVIFWKQIRQFETPTMDPEKLIYVKVAMCFSHSRSFISSADMCWWSHMVWKIHQWFSPSETFMATAEASYLLMKPFREIPEKIPTFDPWKILFKSNLKPIKIRSNPHLLSSFGYWSPSICWSPSSTLW